MRPGPALPVNLLPRRGLPIAGGVILAVAVIAAVVIVFRPKDPPPATPTLVAAPEPVAPVVPAEPTLGDKLAEAKTLDAAIKLALPLMTDSVDEVSPGAAVFGTWANKNLRWAELSAREETKYALVLKDADTERLGHRRHHQRSSGPRRVVRCARGAHRLRPG